MNILVIDIGGTNVKFLATGQTDPRKFASGPEMTPEQMVAGVLDAAKDWQYDVISMGFPGPVLCGQPMTEPVNLGPGWMGFDFAAAFGCPVKVINDAAMQALGSYHGGKMLFLGLGTGVGTAVVMDGMLEPLELGRFHYKKHTLEYYLGARGFKRQGRKKWQRQVEQVVERLVHALKPTDVVLGGGNAKKLDPLPPGTRLGDNSFAFLGGFRLWDSTKPSECGASVSENGSEDIPPAGQAPASAS
ncbi:MAG: ROK family protein [Planctomycetaceae bacterium]|nr:ROK family protein [Planctomycetaceae bacterium]